MNSLVSVSDIDCLVNLRMDRNTFERLCALLVVIRLHTILFPKPEPVTDDNDNRRWKYFKGCIGALDGTYINVLVGNMDKPRYRNRTGQIATNTLSVCDRKIRFMFFYLG